MIVAVASLAASVEAAVSGAAAPVVVGDVLRHFVPAHLSGHLNSVGSQRAETVHLFRVVVVPLVALPADMV